MFKEENKVGTDYRSLSGYNGPGKLCTAMYYLILINYNILHGYSLQSTDKPSVLLSLGVLSPP